jgi:hypothetical protein
MKQWTARTSARCSKKQPAANPLQEEILYAF